MTGYQQDALERTPVRAYAVVLLLFVFQTLNFFDKLAFGVSGVPLMQEFGITPKQFGLIGAVFFIFFAVGGTIIGSFFVGRYRSKTILLALAAIWTVSQFPTAFTHSLAVIIACRMLLGIGEGAALATAMTAAFEWFPVARRNLPSAVILQGISAGFLVGGPLLSFFVIKFGWRSSFLVCGLLCLIWMLLYIAIAKDGPFMHRRAVPAVGGFKLPFRVLWLDRTVLGVLLMTLCSYWVIGMAAVWLPPYLRLGLGYAPMQAGWIISAVYVAQSPLLLASGWFTQAMRLSGWSSRACLGISSGLAMLVSGFALVAAVISPVGWGQTALLAAAFSVPSVTTIFGPVILSAVAPPAQRDRLIVVIIAATSIAAFFSSYANGWIVGQFPKNQHYGFALAFGLGGLVLLLGSLFAFAMMFPEKTEIRFRTYGAGMQKTSGEPFLEPKHNAV
jgi:MFS family permease